MEIDAMKFEKLKPGMVVYNVGRTKMGNTNISSVGVWKVRVISVAEDGRSVQASWNGNPPKTFYRREAEKWREKEPLLIRSGFGCARLATREEIKAARAPAVGAA
jgi:hypothetical protein